jgi:hypothetical protein
LSPVFLLLNLGLINLTSTLWAKGVTSAKSLPTLWTRQLDTGFEMYDGNGALRKIYVINFQS